MHIARLVALIASCLWWASSAAAESQSPNVLLIVSDDLTACLSCYGNEVCESPNLDRLASEGVLFERAYCQYPICGPSRASFMSGLYPHRTKVLQNDKSIGSYRVINPDLADHPSIGGFLRRNGYVSMRVSKIFHMGIPGGIEAGEPGGDDPDSWDRAFNVIAPETASPGTLELLSPNRKHWGSNFARVRVPDDLTATQVDSVTTDLAVAILENRARGRTDSHFVRPEQPFFLAVGLIRPHVPLIAPERLFERYPSEEMELPEVPADDLADVPAPAAAMENERRYGMNIDQQRKAIAAYYASVSYMDEQVGRMLDALDRLGLRENTVVIFTSDHGYNLGEHRCWQKVSLFEESVRVPLIISAPGHQETAGQRSTALVELIDLYPTIADLAGKGENAPEILQGHSLRFALADPSDSGPRDVAYTVTRPHGFSLRTDRWRYNSWGDAGEELYDHNNDPHEFENLADDAQYDNVLASLREKLADFKARNKP